MNHHEGHGVVRVLNEFSPGFMLGREEMRKYVDPKYEGPLVPKFQLCYCKDCHEYVVEAREMTGDEDKILSVDCMAQQKLDNFKRGLKQYRAEHA